MAGKGACMYRLSPSKLIPGYLLSMMDFSARINSESSISSSL